MEILVLNRAARTGVVLTVPKYTILNSLGHQKQTGAAIFSAVRTPWAAILGLVSVVEGGLGEHDRLG